MYTVWIRFASDYKTLVTFMFNGVCNFGCVFLDVCCACLVSVYLLLMILCWLG